jgi:hypothetical protein
MKALKKSWSEKTDGGRSWKKISRADWLSTDMHGYNLLSACPDTQEVGAYHFDISVPSS